MTKWNQFRQLATVAGLTITLLGGSTFALAQRTGDSARVTVGIVEGKQRVDLKSNTGRNSLIGGALGWGLARNQSSSYTGSGRPGRRRPGWWRNQCGAGRQRWPRNTPSAPVQVAPSRLSLTKLKSS